MTSTASTPSEATPPPSSSATPAPPSSSSSSSAKPLTGGRLPSLNQLAARINSTGNAQPPAPASSAARPRLAAFTLRTNSAASAASSAQTNDSMAVNPPTTRSVSPTASSTSGAAATPNGGAENDGRSASIASGGEPLTTEKLEKFNLETGTVAPLPDKPRTKVGYKNIPSLDAITARMVKTRQLSIDGTSKPPEPAYIEDPKTPGVTMKAPEHPLQYPWTFYHDSKAKFNAPVSQPNSAAPDGTFGVHADSTDYEAGLTVIGEFNTVEEFCRYFNWLKPPSKLERNSNYHLFKSGIKPMWEDEANANGGKWVLTMKNNPQLLDRCWSWLAMALVGEELEGDADEICGAVVSLRSKVDRIQVWTRSKEDVEKLNGIGKKLVKLLDVSEADGIGLEFQYNTEDRPQPNRFLNISAVPNTGYRNSFQSPASGAGRSFANGPGGNDQGPPPGAGNGGGQGASGPTAFGSFGMGGLGGWKPAKRG